MCQMSRRLDKMAPIPQERLALVAPPASGSPEPGSPQSGSDLMSPRIPTSPQVNVKGGEWRSKLSSVGEQWASSTSLEHSTNPIVEAPVVKSTPRNARNYPAPESVPAITGAMPEGALASESVTLDQPQSPHDAQAMATFAALRNKMKKKTQASAEPKTCEVEADCSWGEVEVEADCSWGDGGTANASVPAIQNMPQGSVEGSVSLDVGVPSATPHSPEAHQAMADLKAKIAAKQSAKKEISMRSSLDVQLSM